MDDMKYQNEENLRVINTKDTEISYMQKDIAQLREIIDRGQEEQEELKKLIEELENKNRRLNEKLNEVIYNKAAAYKERTIQALQRGDSPDRRERIDNYGIRVDREITQENSYKNN